MKSGGFMTKHTMELVWHSCTDCPPEEDYNDCLYVTDGEDIAEVEWKREGAHQYFVIDDAPWERFYLEVGVNSDGWWWADLIQTVNGFAPIQKK